VIPVVPIEWCRWEAAYLPVDHRCVGGPVIQCPTADGNDCGCCSSCIEAQLSDPRYSRTP
jgi:hypothetical protein